MPAENQQIMSDSVKTEPVVELILMDQLAEVFATILNTP